MFSWVPKFEGSPPPDEDVSAGLRNWGTRPPMLGSQGLAFRNVVIFFIDVWILLVLI
jgi:hypothetical protein